MFDFQNLDAAISVESNSNNRDAEPATGQRKRNVGNTRRVALNRVLHREHKREMRDAMSNGTHDTIDFITANCSSCGLSESNCMCCDDCGRYHCECTLDLDHGDFRDVCTTCESYVCKCDEIAADNAAEDAQNDIDYDPFWYEGYNYSRPRSYFTSETEVEEFLAWAGGARLEEIVNGINDMRLEHIDLDELKLHDFFWRDYSEHHQFAFNHHEGDDNMNDRNRHLTDTAAFVADFTRECSDITFEFPAQRRKFVVMPGGRTKKVRNRFDNFYSNSEYTRPVARTNSFNHQEVRQFFDDIVLDREEAAKARRRQEHLDGINAHCNPAYGNRFARTPGVEVIVKGRNSRRLPPGRVVKEASGKLVWMVDEQALAA